MHYFGFREFGRKWGGGSGGGVTPDPFPADLLAASGDYVHFAAEDAGGATWASRHGLALSMDRNGSVSVSAGWLDTAAGVYLVDRTPWPADTAFSLWGLVKPILAGSDIMFYNGLTNNTVSASNVRFSATTTASIIAGNNRLRNFAATATSAGTSLQWDRPTGGSQADVSAYQDGASLSVTATSGNGLGISADGPRFVIGGEPVRNDTATPPAIDYSGIQIRDVVLTIGWTLDATQRAALEDYRQMRAA